MPWALRAPARSHSRCIVADWSMTQAPGAQALNWKVQAATGEYQLQLTLSSTRPPVLNGAGGLSLKADAPGAASYYYSMPQLQAVGSITRQGAAIPVAGMVWLDREWGSGSLGATQQGWDWFALDLDDGSSLMFYGLRDRDGQRDPHSAGTFVDQPGISRRLPMMRSRSRCCATGTARVAGITRRSGGCGSRHWICSCRWRRCWPIRSWRLNRDTGKAAVRVTGQRRATPVTAFGYVELVGYAQAQAKPQHPECERTAYPLRQSAPTALHAGRGDQRAQPPATAKPSRCAMMSVCSPDVPSQPSMMTPAMRGPYRCAGRMLRMCRSRQE
ncbi:MAG: carotenoid 1,2-hydratase [Steroidobacteraceae bacterium]